MNIKDRILWKKFCDEVLGKLSEDHQFIAKKENFKKMCKKWGKAWIDYLNASYTAFIEGNGMNEEEFMDYNGIPDYYRSNLKILECKVL
jgi:recombinational DNA repair protein RecT